MSLNSDTKPITKPRRKRLGEKPRSLGLGKRCLDTATKAEFVKFFFVQRDIKIKVLCFKIDKKMKN